MRCETPARFYKLSFAISNYKILSDKQTKYTNNIEQKP